MEHPEVTNRLEGCQIPAQGNYKKVLCVCAWGLLRSATAAFVLSNPPYHYNTRCCGTNPERALVKIDQTLVSWADEIIFMEQKHVDRTIAMGIDLRNKPYFVLGIPDDYDYRDEGLIKLISYNYHRAGENLFT